ncbi:MAG: MCE family protein [Planctomycetales bacterium]|nr:MCE family protein [Planctomycetales bacterium]
MDDVADSVPEDCSFPLADVKQTRTPGQMAGLVVSRLWLATLLCLIVAGLLVWSQLSSNGPTIEVHFAEGHGLQPDDPVRYRGINVGQVERIVLADNLDGVLVHIHLTEAAAALAREGSRFWIERPDISIGQVRGLDTLVGGRFVGVVPGPADAPASLKFYGLEVASVPIENIASGLEITLESTHRLGLQAGSSVSYRGVTVGHVLSVGLTGDAATVEARAFIKPEYRELIREDTRFWSNSGLGVRIGLGGIELDAETLATIAAGGVSLATPNVPGRLAATGHRFQLFESPRDEWIQWQPRLGIGSGALPQGVPMPRPQLGICCQQGALAVLGAGRQRGWLLPLADGRLLGPANVLSDAAEVEHNLEIAGQEFPLPLENQQNFHSLAISSLPPLGEEQVVAWPRERIRSADSPEEIVITCGTDETTMSIAAQRLSKSEAGWDIDPSVPLDDGWHGASVVATRDGYLVGILIREDDRSQVALLPEELLGSLP